MGKIRILIADDHRLVRDTLASFLNSQEQLEVFATTGDAMEAISLASENSPDIILMDIRLGPLTGLQVTEKIHASQPRSPIIGISVYSLPVYAKKMLQAGAMGYLTKNSPTDEMIWAIMEVYKGKKYICNEIKEIMANSLLEEEEEVNSLSLLTDRELEIIKQIKEGFSSKEISNILHIARKTVEVHRHHILKKLKLKNTASLVNFINTSATFI
jgi:DNA-binding NarL/FixJ family response regulator